MVLAQATAHLITQTVHPLSTFLGSCSLSLDCVSTYKMQMVPEDSFWTFGTVSLMSAHVSIPRRRARTDSRASGSLTTVVWACGGRGIWTSHQGDADSTA